MLNTEQSIELVSTLPTLPADSLDFLTKQSIYSILLLFD